MVCLINSSPPGSNSILSKVAPGALALLIAATALVLAPSTTGAAAPSPNYYVSVGDSYSIGYQPDPALAYRHGYTNTVLSLERKRGTTLTLVNFGCGGATTTSLLTANGCPLGAPHGPRYPTTPQATAALHFIANHHGHIGLITVSIGGNDVTACAVAANPTSCVVHVIPTVATNISTLVKELHAAAGKRVPIVGTTYPDVILGTWVHPPVSQALAKLSVAAFGLIINPAMKRAYTDNGGTFVDVTAATGAYIPLSKTVTLRPYGRIPVAVANVCILTWFCSRGDIHPHTSGYQLIGQRIVGVLAKKLP
jgi:lysophospholipase L1-like esterase